VTIARAGLSPAPLGVRAAKHAMLNYLLLGLVAVFLLAGLIAIGVGNKRWNWGTVAAAILTLLTACGFLVLAARMAAYEWSWRRVVEAKQTRLAEVEAGLVPRGPGGRLVHVVVMGQSGLQQGLAIYEDQAALAAALGGDEQAAARSTSLAVMYGEPFEISARDYDAIERSGFDVAGPEAWPLVVRMDPGFTVRPPLVWEVELITACLSDVVTRVSV